MTKGPVRRIILPTGADHLTQAGADLAKLGGASGPLSIAARAQAAHKAREARSVMPSSLDLYNHNPVVCMATIAQQMRVLPDFLLQKDRLVEALDKLGLGYDGADLATIEMIQVMANAQIALRSIVARGEAALREETLRPRGEAAEAAVMARAQPADAAPREPAEGR